MTPEGLTLLIGSLGAFFVVIGGGAKWMLSHLDGKDKASALRESEARNELSKLLNDEISLLRQDLAKVQSEKSLYLKRIYQLEYFIHTQPGISIPAMEGWPPV
jgi:hypothetical protein